MKKKDFVKFYEMVDKTGFVFNPMVNYSGSFFLKTGTDNSYFDYDKNKDVFYLNSKKEKENNKYEEFVNKYFVSLFGNPPNKAIMPVIHPVLISTVTKDGNGRCVNFSYALTLYMLLEESSLISDAPEDDLDLALYVKDYIKSRRDKIFDVLRKWNKSSYYNEVKYFYKSHDYKIDFDFLDKQKEYLTELILILNNIADKIKENKFEKNEFEKCFDKDKLILILCKCIIDGCYSCDKLDDFANNSLVEILQLFHNLEELKMENRFNPEIKYFNSKTQKVEKYTFNNLKDEVNKYLQEHPEYQINTYANNEFISKSNDWVDYFLDNEKREILMDGWDLKINDDIEDEVNISLKESKDYFKTINVEVLLEKLGHTFKLIGKKSFVGYISYINNNGNVFLKRIYDIKGNSKNDVLYFMDIDKLIELTTMEKNEIDKYLSSTNNIELKRFYYSPILEQKILSFYSNISYDDMEKDIKKFINIAKKRKEKQER